MLALAGAPLGLEFTFLEPAEGASAAQVGRQLVGAYDDPRLLAQLRRRFGTWSPSSSESVPEKLRRRCSARAARSSPSSCARGRPGSLLEKRMFQSLEIPTATYAEVGSNSDLVAALDQVPVPARLKSRRLGYDGHGQALVLESGELEGAWVELGRAPADLGAVRAL